MDFDRYILNEGDAEYLGERISCYKKEAPKNAKWLTPYVEKFSTENDYEGLKKINDREEYILAIVSGSSKYPRLKSLIPLRPPNARERDFCKGRGKVGGAEMVCKCGGVGWLE